MVVISGITKLSCQIWYASNRLSTRFCNAGSPAAAARSRAKSSAIGFCAALYGCRNSSSPVAWYPRRPVSSSTINLESSAVSAMFWSDCWIRLTVVCAPRICDASTRATASSAITGTIRLCNRMYWNWRRFTAAGPSRPQRSAGAASADGRCLPAAQAGPHHWACRCQPPPALTAAVRGRRRAAGSEPAGWPRAF